MARTSNTPVWPTHKAKARTRRRIRKIVARKGVVNSVG